jgi:RNA polymerase sigma factor (sigma-70 family)
MELPSDAVSAHLVVRWRNGDQEAAAELFRRYSDRLIGLARNRLSSKLAARVDAEDLVQSVYRSFFAGARGDRYDLRRGGDLWRLLVTITLHKLHDQIDWHTARKRSIKAEKTFGTEDSLYWQALSREPSPVEAITLMEELEQVMGQLGALQRRILELRLQGHNHTEIAAEARCSERTVIRVLKRVRELLEQRWSL